MAYTLHIAKPRFKFSSSHFTIFNANDAERLHGHNYRVKVNLTFSDVDEQTGLTVDFNQLKQQIDELCQSLDEKVLLPSQSDFLQIGESDGQVEVSFANKRYSFPEEDCCMLPLQNVSTELLAYWFYENLKPAFGKKVQKMSVTVSESQGQSVTYCP